jgi:hypothetical protein
MSDELKVRRIFYVHLLNEDVQKNDESRFVAENIRIGPSGVLECDRVFNDCETKLKVFYNGQFNIVEMDREEVEHFGDEDCGHHHDEDDE